MTIFPTKIMLATDGSEDAQRAAGLAAEISKSTESELHVVHVENEPIMAEVHVAPDVQRMSTQAARQLLDEQSEQVENAGANIAERHLLTGTPADAVIQLAEDIEAGLIVTGSRGREGIQRLLMGSVSETIVRYAHCPVLVVRDERVETFPTRILLATDGSEDADLALGAAVELANSTGSELHLVTVALGYPDYAEEAPEVAEQIRSDAKVTLEEQAKNVEKAGGKVAEQHLQVAERDRPQQIVQVAEDIEAGLIIMGSRGLRGLKRMLMGSVSDSVVRHAHCPVMVMRQDRQESGRE